MRTRLVSMISTGALLLTGSIAVVAAASQQELPPDHTATVDAVDGDVQGVRGQR
jgi:hypothetical protein